MLVPLNILVGHGISYDHKDCDGVKTWRNVTLVFGGVLKLKDKSSESHCNRVSWTMTLG